MPFWIKIMQACLHARQASRPDSWSITKRSSIIDLQLHRQEMRLNLSLGEKDISQASPARLPPVDLRLRNKQNSFATENHSAKVFSVVIPQQPRIPGARRG